MHVKVSISEVTVKGHINDLSKDSEN